MNRAQVVQSIEALRGGETVLVPTALGYALACTIAPESVFRATRTLADTGIGSPAIIAITRALDLQRVVATPPSRATQRLMDHCWPGMLGLKLPARRSLPRPLQHDGLALLWMTADPELLELSYRLRAPLALWRVPDAGGAAAPSLACAADRLGLTGFAAVIGRPEPIAPGTLTVVEPAPSAGRLVQAGDLPVEEIEAILGPLVRATDAP